MARVTMTIVMMVKTKMKTKMKMIESMLIHNTEANNAIARMQGRRRHHDTCSLLGTRGAQAS